MISGWDRGKCVNENVTATVDQSDTKEVKGDVHLTVIAVIEYICIGDTMFINIVTPIIWLSFS